MSITFVFKGISPNASNVLVKKKKKIYSEFCLRYNLEMQPYHYFLKLLSL